MKIHNIIGFIKWHARKYKFGIGTVFVLCIGYMWMNIIFVSTRSPWYIINLIIGLIPLVIMWLYLFIVYPLQESYKKYQQEKRDILNTIDTGEKFNG